jgi:5-methylcytosine-specific restriction enzyme subunit McrC
METSIPIQNIYFMLSYAYKTLNLSEYKKIGVQQFTDVKELYAEILSIGIPVLIRGGLIKEYINIDEKSTVLRGKIDINSSIKQNALADKKLIITYDEFSEDNLLNQIIKATLLCLERSMEIRRTHRKKILSYLPYFSNVSDIELNLYLWKNVQYNHQNIRYQFLIDICRFTYEELLLTEDVSSKERPHFQDDQRLASLYEKFVVAFYKRETTFSVSRPQIKWMVDNEFTEALPVMQTDLVLKKDNKTLIIDAKFHAENMISRFKNGRVKQISNNLYQIFAYINNWKSEKDETVGGMLLYAKTKATTQPNHRYQIKGKTIIITSLDLDQSFDGIKKDLISFASDYFNN